MPHKVLGKLCKIQIKIQIKYCKLISLKLDMFSTQKWNDLFCFGRHYCYIRLLYSRGSTDCSRGDEYRQSQFQNIWKLHASSRGFLHIWPCLACVHSQHWSVHWDKLVAVLLATTRGRGKYSYLIGYNKRVRLVITFYWLQQVGEGG